MKHSINIVSGGQPLEKAGKALILLHGRGGSAEDILGLAAHFNVSDYALLAPQATNHTWYPHSFMAPVQQNEPWLSSALEVVGETFQKAVERNIKPENIYLFGFSQGACLTLEFAARNAQKLGGIAAVIGGLIGEKINPQNYKGNFAGTPTFIGTSDSDFHVPVERVYASANILKSLGANVIEKVYANLGHTINQDEVDLINKNIFK